MAVRQDELAALSGEVDLDRDRALVERCQGGDSSAFGDLYSRYYDRLFRFCLRRLHDRDEAEDATQEAFARAWRALPNFVGERRFYPWLTVIAGNVCTDILRRRFRSAPTSDVEMAARHGVDTTGGESSEELVLAAVDGELVVRALDRLSDRHRQVLNIREASGWSYQQIANHEGVEIGTIETLLWRARQALKREFTVLSESKSKLAGLALGSTALFRRMAANVGRKADVVRSTGVTFGAREAVIAAAITSVAVATAVVSPSHSPTAASPAAKVVQSLPAVVSPTTPSSSAVSATTNSPTATSLVSGIPSSSGSATAPLNLGTSSPSHFLPVSPSTPAGSTILSQSGTGLSLPSANSVSPGSTGLSLGPTSLLTALASLTTAVETVTQSVTQTVTTIVSGTLGTASGLLGGKPLGGGSLTPGGQLGNQLFGQGLVDLALSLIGGSAPASSQAAPIHTSASKSTSGTSTSDSSTSSGSSSTGSSSGSSSTGSSGSSETSSSSGQTPPPSSDGSTPSS